ncbi:MAG: FecR family protein, partial [Endomicrobia bacterium]|nr:FecR family protein [Endomicrobiia bacterium]
MKKIVIFITILLIFLPILRLKGQDYTAVIGQVSGKVEIFANNIWQKAAVGKVLSSEDKIRTYKKSYCVIMFKDGHTVKISENTELTISSLISDKIELKLDKGRVRSKVSKLTQEQTFKVRTPTLVFAVRGTDFAVEYDDGKTKLDVYEGVVAAIEEISGREVEVNEGKSLFYTPGVEEPIQIREIPLEDLKKKETEDKEITVLPEKSAQEQFRAELEQEIYYEISREQVLSRAAEEIKLAEYQNGKTLVDVFGKRVRLEEYIVRPQPNQFKYVVLNTREDRFDFGKILFTFNKNLPNDLTIVTKNMIEYYGSKKPEYILKEVDSVISNTVDTINEKATGGDMFADDPANPTYWRHFFTDYKFYLNHNLRWSYTATISADRISKIKFNYYDKNGNSIPAPVTEFSMPSGEDVLHFSEKNTYSDDVWISRDTYVSDDNGEIIKISDLKSLTSQEINQKAKELNLEIVYKSNEFKGPQNKIDLVCSTKLLIDSGLINLQ